MKDLQIKIKNRLIGEGYPCLVVAEVSGNHQQRFEDALAIIRAAHEAGADAVKLQTYTPDTLTINSDKKWFFFPGDGTPDSWKKTNLYGLYQTAHTPWEWQPKLKKIAEGLGLIFFSTPFDETAVDFLEEMDVPCYKIASYEVTHVPLLKRIARTCKPVILSVGFATDPEITEAVETLRAHGSQEIALLHCVTAYAKDPRAEDMHLANIQNLRERFGVVSGFSDNNAGIEFPLVAATLGASILEKHLTLDRSAGGPDARFSLEPSELKELVSAIRRMEQARGRVQYGPLSERENEYRRVRRSLFVVEDVKRGERFNSKNVRVIRPADGLPPKFLESVLGKAARVDIERGTPLAWDSIIPES